MENKEESLKNQIAKAKHPVIIVPENSPSEVILCGLGIYNFILDQNKKATLAFPGRLPQRFRFFPNTEKIKHQLENIRQFVLSFNTSENKISNVHYEKESDRLNIFITPQKGAINPKDFFFSLGQFKYDLVIILGATDLEAVGECFSQNADLFFEVPVVNLDCNIENEQYGQINLVDPKCSGISELVTRFFFKNQITIPPVAAGCFYAGILEATESFQSPRTTPNSLTAAAKLIDSGADHQEIVRRLYKTQNLSIIRFWGRLMARLRRLNEANFSWTIAHRKDLEETNFKTEEIRAVFNKIKNNCSKEENLMLLWESPNAPTRGLFQGALADFFLKEFKGVDWEGVVLFETPDRLLEAEIKIIAEIKNQSKK